MLSSLLALLLLLLLMLLLLLLLCGLASCLPLSFELVGTSSCSSSTETSFRFSFSKSDWLNSNLCRHAALWLPLPELHLGQSLFRTMADDPFLCNVRRSGHSLLTLSHLCLGVPRCHVNLRHKLGAPTKLLGHPPYRSHLLASSYQTNYQVAVIIIVLSYPNTSGKYRFQFASTCCYSRAAPVPDLLSYLRDLPFSYSFPKRNLYD